MNAYGWLHLARPVRWALSFVSLLMDVSSELVHGLLPVFLVGVLGASAFMVGLIEGAAEATALIVKVFSGAPRYFTSPHSGPIHTFGNQLPVCSGARRNRACGVTSITFRRRESPRDCHSACVGLNWPV